MKQEFYKIKSFIGKTAEFLSSLINAEIVEI